MSHPLATTDRLNLAAAVFLAEASQAAYNPDLDADVWARPRGFPGGVSSFENKEAQVQGFWCAEGEIALLALRGTENIRHWIRNLKVWPWEHPWGHVHLGFFDGVVKVESHIEDFIQAARGKKYVWITGHSLGGAMAVCAAARARIGGVDATTYTFGQPMMCRSDFSQRFAMELPGRYLRFVNQKDIVPSVPPGYGHFGGMKRIVRPGHLEGGLESLEAAVKTVPVPAAARSAVAVIEAGVQESVAAVAAAEITKPLLIDAEMPALTNEQFLELQIALGGAQAEGGLEGLEWTPPWFHDHKISEYIRLLGEIRDQA